MNPKQLRARFPYMFAGKNIGFDLARGWFPAFVKLCEDIDALLGDDEHGFHWVQLKEKFGSARYYWEMAGNTARLHLSLVSEDGVLEVGPSDPKGSLAARIQRLVNEATDATRSCCIVCGEPATLDQSQPYVLMLCAHHTMQRQQGELDSPWFSEEEEH